MKRLFALLLLFFLLTEAMGQRAGIHTDDSLPHGDSKTKYRKM